MTVNATTLVKKRADKLGVKLTALIDNSDQKQFELVIGGVTLCYDNLGKVQSALDAIHFQRLGDMHKIDHRIKIGMELKHYAKKHKKNYTVTDFLITKNTLGEVVRVEIECIQNVLGQEVKTTFPQAEIILSILR